MKYAKAYLGNEKPEYPGGTTQGEAHLVESLSRGEAEGFNPEIKS